MVKSKPMVCIEQTGRRLFEEEVSAFEHRIGHRLPESYRRFLLETNGGMPTPEIDTIDVEHLLGSPTDVQVFFGIDSRVMSSDIEWNMNSLKDRISNQMLPIACDSGGNIFCISLSTSDFGSVIYCDFDPNWHLGGAIYYRVAPDFDSFLERIRSLEDN